VSIAQQLLDAGLVDELHVDIMLVFLGIGLRAFESSSLERVRLEKISVQEVGARTSLRFRMKPTFWADCKQCKRSVYRTRSPPRESINSSCSLV